MRGYFSLAAIKKMPAKNSRKARINRGALTFTRCLWISEKFPRASHNKSASSDKLIITLMKGNSLFFFIIHAFG
jgi:hypothetical protein